MAAFMGQDLWQALRGLVKRPGVPAVAVVVLALGMGANTALFSMLDRVLLHPFPYRDLDRLVQIAAFSGTARATRLSPAEFDYLRHATGAFENAALWRWQSPLLTGVPDPENIFGQETGPGLFDILGARPALGRVLRAEDFESGAAPVVVIGDRLWRKQFHADPAIVGRQILLDGRGTTVVGVMGPEFVFTEPVYQLWMPLGSAAARAGELSHGFNALARLRPRVTLAQAA